MLHTGLCQEYRFQRVVFPNIRGALNCPILKDKSEHPSKHPVQKTGRGFRETIQGANAAY